MSALDICEYVCYTVFVAKLNLHKGRRRFLDKKYKTIHGNDLQYTEKFNPRIEEEVYMALFHNMVLVENKGIGLLMKCDEFLPKGHTVAVNRIFGTRDFYGEMITSYHDHNFYEANYVHSGTLVECIEGEKYVLHAGDLLLLSPGIHHSNFPLTGTNAVNIICKSDFITALEQKLAKVGTTSYLSRLVKQQSFLIFKNTEKICSSELVSEMHELDKKSNEPYCGFLRENLAERLFTLLSECERLDHLYTPSGSSATARERSDKILKYIRENYAAVSIEDVSRAFGYSEQHIRRIILGATGMNFQTYLQSVRMGKSEQLLTGTLLPIKEIAEIIGLGSSEYFSRWFKFQHGESPVEYRKNHSKHKTDA